MHEVNEEESAVCLAACEHAWQLLAAFCLHSGFAGCRMLLSLQASRARSGRLQLGSCLAQVDVHSFVAIQRFDLQIRHASVTRLCQAELGP